ncbi:YfiR family protein [Agaribacterium sp. ZY112]|uniref:YfiR family protein n=1 Tax=Agaribacterium sp. ZY112 TaxID=3233574 RepID=UPI0035259043
MPHPQQTLIHPKQWHFLVSALLLCALFSNSGVTWAGVNDSELRATIVYRLLQFSSWKGQVPGQTRICVIGSKSLHRELLSISQHVKKGFDVKQVNVPPPSSCDIIVAGPKAQKLKLADIQRKFLICSSCKSEELAAIHLYRFGNKIQFNINRKIADTRGIHFKSSVLKAASKVEAGS